MTADQAKDILKTLQTILTEVEAVRFAVYLVVGLFILNVLAQIFRKKNGNG